MALLVNLVGADSDATSSLFSDDKVLVGMEGDANDSSFLSPMWGSFSAFSLDAVEGVLKEANIESRPIRVDVQSDEQIPSLQNHDVDLNAGLAMTWSRMAKIEFVGPVDSGALGVLVRAGGAKRIQRVADLEGKYVCTQVGSTAAEIVERVTYSV
ncbi:transporter substrate-binding domain-containing protein [Streptomyces atriruber]|uniref:Transporter substrate-binding domain-containing protein n=1 Tax=Streptomyces atriruber TaxID=545121 RepID=A0ABV3BMU8_9ACTN